MESLSLYLYSQFAQETQLNEEEGNKGLFGGICGMFAGIFGSIAYSGEALKARKETLENKKTKMAEMRKKLKEAQDKKKAASIRANANAELRQWELRQQALIDRIKQEENEIKELDKKFSKTTERYSPQEMLLFAAKIDKLEKGLGEQERTSIDKIKDKMLICLVDSNGKLLSDDEIKKNLDEASKDDDFKQHLEKTLNSAGIKKDNNGNWEAGANIAKSLIEIHANINIGKTEKQLEDALEKANNELTEFEANEKAYNDAKTKKTDADNKIKDIEEKEKIIRDVLGEKSSGFFNKKSDLSKLNPDNLSDEIKNKVGGELKKITNIKTSDISFIKPTDKIGSLESNRKSAVTEFLSKKGVNDPEDFYSKLKLDEKLKDINDDSEEGVSKKLAEVLNSEGIKTEINKTLEEQRNKKINEFKSNLTKYQEGQVELKQLKQDSKDSELIINQYKNDFDKSKSLIDKERKQKQAAVLKIEDDLYTIKNASSVIEGSAKEAMKRAKDDADNDAINKIIPGVKDKIKNNYLDLNPGEYYDSDGNIGTYDKDGNFINRPENSDSKEFKDYKISRNKAIVGGYKPTEHANIDIKVNDNGDVQVWMDGKLQDTTKKEDLELFEKYYIAQEANTAKQDDIKRDRKTLIENSKKRLQELNNKKPEDLTDEDKEELNSIKELASIIPDNEKDEYKDFVSAVEKSTSKDDTDTDTDTKDDDTNDDENDDDRSNSKFDSDDEPEDEEDDEEKRKKQDPRKIWKRKSYKRGNKTYKTKSYYNKKGHSISKDEFNERIRNFERQNSNKQESTSLTVSLKNYLVENNSNSNHRNLSNYFKYRL